MAILALDVGRSGLVALAVAGLASCRPAEAPSLPADTLRIALRADVTGFFPGPPLLSEASTLEANRSVYESLVRFDAALRLRPGLAERWSNPDDRTYRFELRPGVRFSDGTPLTAGDVAASLEANRRGWVTRDYGDAGDVLGSLAHSATGGPLGSLNSVGLADRTLDELIENADRTRTDRERARRLRLAVARVAELRAALPLVVQTEAVVLSRRLAWEAPLNMALSPEDLRPAP